MIGGLPIVSGTACHSTAVALGTVALGPVCQVASGVTTIGGSVAGQVAGFGVDTVLDALGSWVSDGATWLLAQVGGALGATTSVDLSATWFTAHYATMAALTGTVILPIALLGIVQAVYRQNASGLIRSVLVHVPLAILLTAVAVKLVGIGLAVTDAMSSAVAGGSGVDTGHFMTTVTLGLTGAAAAGQSGVPAFVIFLGSLAVVFGAVMVWIELMIRASAIYVAVLFLPLALASLAWPAIAHWCRRLVDTLVALVLGKFVIVAVLSLAVGALAGGTGSSPAGSNGSNASAGGAGAGGFTAVLAGAALLMLAALAPWALFRLLPFVEAGAVGHLEALSHRTRQSAAVPMKSLAHVAMEATGIGSLAGSAAASMAGRPAGSASGPGGGGDGGRGRSGTGGGGTGGGGSSGGGSSGGGSDDGGGEGLPGPGGTGPSGMDSPEIGPSSAQATGVGTTTAPGQSISMYPPHPGASAVANRMMVEFEKERGSRNRTGGGGGGGHRTGGGGGHGTGDGGGGGTGDSGLSPGSVPPPPGPFLSPRRTDVWPSDEGAGGGDG